MIYLIFFQRIFYGYFAYLRKSSSMKHFFNELKRRNVIKETIAYIVVA